MTKIAHLSALERALDYPYDAPDCLLYTSPSPRD